MRKQDAKEYFGFGSKTKVIVVGHQPNFFHPGILAKFIAASEVAKSCNAKLVHLVVDHHIEDGGTIEVPALQNGLLKVEKMKFATCDSTIALCDQKPMKIMTGAPQFAESLLNDAPNAAMQIAAATDELMSPYATVHRRISARSLLKSPLGQELLEKMFADPVACITTYNAAVTAHQCGVPPLALDELPLWSGPRNEKVIEQRSDLRPRALFLTLLARLGVGDLFVHGTGGASYDLAMEHWCRNWLGVEVCPKVMATASMMLPIDITTTDAARETYFSGVGEKKQAYLEKIRFYPRGSALRRITFLDMHRWLASCNKKPNYRKLRKTKHIANRRDWPFVLYSKEQLLTLTKAL